jgi:hypothetical protein
MRQRCLYPRSKKYPRYGGRGITICERWSLFANFLADMGERPAGKTLDRVDNDGNYEPGNCRWATSAEQASNCDTSLKGWKKNNTHCANGHEFTAENTRVRGRSRVCRTCDRERAVAKRSRERQQIQPGLK